MAELSPGITHRDSLIITPELTVPQLSPALAEFADMPPVFATAYMVGFMEATCIALLRPCLSDGQHSVGTAVNVNHTAATMVGMQVTASVELVEVDGRKLRFNVIAHDEAGPIGQGTHDRFIIDIATFMDRAAQRAG